MVPEDEFSVDRLGRHIYTVVVHWCQMNAAEGYEGSQTFLTYQNHAFYPLKGKFIENWIYIVSNVITLL